MRDPLATMGDWLIGTPALALVPATVFFMLYVLRRRPLAFVAGISWSLYCVYEYLMRARVLCSGECDIRVDLLVIYPLLLLVSVIGLVVTLWPRRG
jgi:hypothetical protein